MKMLLKSQMLFYYAFYLHITERSLEGILSTSVWYLAVRKPELILYQFRQVTVYQ